MTTDIKLNQLIEWTAEDRAKGECPLPDGSDVTVWFVEGSIGRFVSLKGEGGWGEYPAYITAYLVHSVPREPIVRWLIVGGAADGYWYEAKEKAEQMMSNHGGRVVKMVEEMEGQDDG